MAFAGSSGIGATIIPVTPKMRAMKLDQAVEDAYYAVFLQMQKLEKRLRVPAPPKVPTTYVRGSSLESHVNDKWYIRDERGIATDLYNPVSYARFVYGDNRGQGQMSYHISTGWPNMYRLFLKSRTTMITAAQAAFSAGVARAVANA